MTSPKTGPSWGWLFLVWPLLAWSAEPMLRGTGDLGVIVERGAGRVVIVSTSTNRIVQVPRFGLFTHQSFSGIGGSGFPEVTTI